MAEDTRGWSDVIAEELKETTMIMSDVSRDSNEEIQEIMAYALDSPGKLIRPSMIILVAKACGAESDRRILNYAAGAEFIHIATLVHDDIDDESENRRGKMATYKKYGVRKALTAGDLLLVKAMGLFDSNPEVLHNIINMGSAIADSEFIQNNHKNDLDMLESEYYQVISGKTAVFIAECARTGAVVANASQEIKDEMARFGHLYGMAFQIADDLIDLTVEEGVSGKTAMRDLSEGTITLPTIIAMRDKEVGSKIRSSIKKGTSLETVKELILQTDAVDQCKLVIKDYMDEALECLDILPDSPYKQSLIELTRLNLTRLN
jgi:geranylgeranyl pyrophosphate synthase